MPTIYNAVPLNHEAPPPSYFNVINGLKVAKKSSTTPVETVRNTFNVIFGSVCYTGFMLAYTILPAAQILYGYPNTCDSKPFLPYWLTVNGSLGFAYVFINIMTSLINSLNRKSRTDGPSRPTKVLNCLGSIVTIFLMTWFVVGNYLVVSLYIEAQDPDILSNIETFCDKMAYAVAFWTIVAHYVTIGVFCLCVCATVAYAHKK